MQNSKFQKTFDLPWAFLFESFQIEWPSRKPITSHFARVFEIHLKLSSFVEIFATISVAVFFVIFILVFGEHSLLSTDG